MEMLSSSPNKVKISDAGPCLKKVEFEIPASAVSAKMAEAMSAYVANAALPGFRPGRVPQRLIEKKFGPTIREEIKGQLIGQAYRTMMEEYKLKAISEPTGETLVDVKVEDGKPLTFELEVEVVPEFTMPDLDGLEITRPVMEATDAMVDDELMKFRVQEGELEERKEPEPGDYLTGHAIMTGKDDKEYYNLKGAVIQIPTLDKEGKGMVLGIMVNDFSKQLGLPKPGESVTVKCTGPDNHELEELRGQKLAVAFTVERCDRIVPASLDKITASLGFDESSKLKDAVKSRLQQRQQVEQRVSMRRQVADHLIDNTKMELPARASAAQAARALEQKRMELMYRGFDAMQIEEHLAMVRGSSNESAVRELKLLFILNTAADQLGVQVTEQEMNARIMQMAMERGERPEKLRDQIVKQGSANMIFRQIRDHKTFDAILAKAKLTDQPFEVYKKETESKKK